MKIAEPLCVFVGAGLGGVARYWVSGVVQSWWTGREFPVGTLAVNATGCFVMGIAAGLAMRDGPRAFWLVGVLGGYTTFSAFSRETVELAARGGFGRAGLYVVLTNVLALGGTWLGWALTHRTPGQTTG